MAKNIKNRVSVWDYKSGQKDYKSGQGLKIEAKRLLIGADLGITNWTKVGLQIGGAFEITNWGKRITNWGRDYKSVQNSLQDVSNTSSFSIFVFQNFLKTYSQDVLKTSFRCLEDKLEDKKLLS